MTNSEENQSKQFCCADLHSYIICFGFSSTEPHRNLSSQSFLICTFGDEKMKARPSGTILPSLFSLKWDRQNPNIGLVTP